MTVKKKAKKVIKKTTTKKPAAKKPAAKKVEEKNPVGRPTKYDPAFCEVVIEQMALGFSKEAVAGYIGISKDTLYQWAAKHTEFSDAIALGEAKSQYVWEKKSVDFAVHTKNGKQINAQVYNLNMKNRFNWSDKVETKNEDTTEKTKKTFAFTLEEQPAQDDE